MPCPMSVHSTQRADPAGLPDSYRAQLLAGQRIPQPGAVVPVGRGQQQRVTRQRKERERMDTNE
jgi:hypothetical protein